MKRSVLVFLLTCSAFAQTTPGTAGQTSPGNKTDDQAPRTAKPKSDRNRKRANSTTTAPANTPTSPTDSTMPTDPKTPTSPTAPRTPVKPTDPTMPTTKPPSI